MKKIRTTMQPGVEIEVSEKEFTDLTRQGLVYEKDSETKSETELTPDTLADAGKSLGLDATPTKKNRN